MITARIAIAAVALSVSALAPTLATEAPAPPAARFYPFVGNWEGQGELREGQQPAVKLALDYQCRKASAGWAVLCEMKASNDKMVMAETDLFGVDPVTGKGHWFAVTNAGETHNHRAEWTDAKTMKGHHAWNQNGKKMEENVTIRFDGSQTMTFQSTVSADGATVMQFAGTLKQ